MSLKLKDELEISSSFDYLMEEDANIALELARCLASNIKWKFVGFWIDENFNIDIFEMIAKTSKLVKELVNKEFWFWSDTKWPSKTSNAIFNNGRNIGWILKFAHQILRVAR